MDEFEVDMLVMCILTECPGIGYTEARRRAIVEIREIRELDGPK